MQAFARGSLQKSFFGRKMEAFLASFLVNPPLDSCERRRLAMASLSLSRLSLDDEEYLILWMRIADGFYFLHTVRAKGIDPHAVLFGYQVLRRLSFGASIAKKARSRVNILSHSDIRP